LFSVFVKGGNHCATRQLSLDVADEQLRHRMLEILNKPSRHEMEEELLKLRLELSAKGSFKVLRLSYAVFLFTSF
jgi:hypothetical protein